MVDQAYRAALFPILLGLAWLISSFNPIPSLAGEARAVEKTFGVGFARISFDDPVGGRMLVSIWYPSDVSGGTVTLGPFEFVGTRDSKPAKGPFNLVVISHGTGGSDLGHRDTAIALAKAGFIAAAPLHPRDNFQDQSGSGRRIVWDGRPRQLTAVIDQMLAHPSFGPRIDPASIGAFGFSLGGYTVLANLGARPALSDVIRHCGAHSDADPFCGFGGQRDAKERAQRTKEYEGPSDEFHDPRLSAAVIADPVAVPFPSTTLAKLPPAKLLFFRPEHEDVLKAQFHISRIFGALRDRPEFPTPREIVVPGAGHYSFIAPFPPAIAKQYPEIAFDRPRFNRASFHEAMNETIAAFFVNALSVREEN